MTTFLVANTTSNSLVHLGQYDHRRRRLKEAASSQQDDCGRYSSQPFLSPTAKAMNHLLYGSFDRGEFGLLARIHDYIGDNVTALQEQNWKYLPASYLHASLRASNILFEQRNSFGKLVGSKYKKNWSLKRLQQQQRENDESSSSSAFVECETYFPTDSGSLKRGSLKALDGKGCHRYSPSMNIGHDMVCHNGTCIAYREANCECNSTSVPGHKYGEHHANWAKEQGRKFQVFTFHSCSYPKSREGIEEMIAASNSLWEFRAQWSRFWQPALYKGWTECTATLNIIDKEMVDAVLYKLPITDHRNVSVCELDAHRRYFLSQGLRLMYEKGYASLPVLFLKETRGMDQLECDLYWGGTDCEDGFRKEFFAQELNLTDGACLAIPPGCKDAYYFPFDNQTGRCSAFSEASVARASISSSCYYRENMWAFLSSTTGASGMEGYADGGVPEINYSNVVVFQSFAAVVLGILYFVRKKLKAKP